LAQYLAACFQSENVLQRTLFVGARKYLDNKSRSTRIRKNKKGGKNEGTKNSKNVFVKLTSSFQIELAHGNNISDAEQ
jgi:hypothetical protein